MKKHFRIDIDERGMSRVACGWRDWNWMQTSRWKKDVTCERCRNTIVFRDTEEKSEYQNGGRDAIKV